MTADANVVAFKARNSQRPLLDPRDPMPSARKLIARDYTVWSPEYDGPEEIRTLHHSAGDFLTWAGTHYARADDDAVRAAIWRFLERAERTGKDGAKLPFQPTTARANDVFNALKAAANLDARLVAPAWLPGTENGKPSAAEILPCSNGLLHVPTRMLLPSMPSFFSFNALPYPYEAVASEPTEWLKFLESIWGEDPETVQTLQEWFGYALTQDTRYHKILLIVGPKRSGKGTIGRVLQAMLGQANVAGPTLGSLSGPFGLEPLLDKQLALISDARLGGRADQSTIAERLLAISGEDGISVDRKHRTAWFGRMPVRFMLLTNETPKISDASGALASRFIVLRCTESFLGREDHDLERRLVAELPGILLWALGGLARLSARQRFVQAASAADAIRELEDLGSPISAFLRDRCEIGPDKSVERGALYVAWNEWCTQNGQRQVGTETTFGRDLRAVLPRLGRTQPRAGSERISCYSGVGLVEQEFEPINQ